MGRRARRRGAQPMSPSTAKTAKTPAQARFANGMANSTHKQAPFLNYFRPPYIFQPPWDPLRSWRRFSGTALRAVRRKV
jgi:hypothetical protein